MWVNALRLPQSFPAFSAGKLNLCTAVQQYLHSVGKITCLLHIDYSQTIYTTIAADFLQTEVINPDIAYAVNRYNEM